MICSKQKSGDGYDSPSKEEQDMKDLWNFKRIITSCEILQPNPPRCNAGNCDLMACCIYICTKDTKSVKHLCLDHQQEIFGGWPTRSELKLGQFDLSMGMMFGNEWNPIQMAHPHRHPAVIGSTINHAAVAGIGGNEETPEARSSNDNEDDEGSVGAAGGNGESMPTISGMTPLVFAPAGMHTNNQMIARAPVGATLGHGSFHHQGLMQVVSADSGTDSRIATMAHHPYPAALAQLVTLPFGSVLPAQQQPKKWVRWNDQEDNALRRAVHQRGDNNFELISKHLFHGTRSEAQCKNRWKKALQPGLVKGRWTKEEDDIIA